MRTCVSLGATVLPGSVASASSQRTSPARILAVRFARIGDILFTTPALECLAEAFPKARIDYLTTPYGREVIGCHPAVADVVEFNRGWILPDYLWRKHRLCQEIQSRRYDVAVIFESRTKTRRMLERLFRAAGVRHVVSEHLQPGPTSETRPLHTCQRHQAMLAALGISADERPYTYHYAARHVEAARALLGRHGVDETGGTRPPLVGMQVGSHYSMLPSWFFWYGRHRHYKNWPFERWSELGTRLAREFGARSVLTGAGEEREIVLRIAAAMDAPEELRPIVVAGETSIAELGALLDDLDLFISVDTGSMHLASALGVPTLALFGPTNPARHGPYRRSETTRVLRTGITCSPCHSRERKRCPLNRCLTELSVAQVFRAAKAGLEGEMAPASRAGPAASGFSSTERMEDPPPTL